MRQRFVMAMMFLALTGAGLRAQATDKAPKPQAAPVMDASGPQTRAETTAVRHELLGYLATSPTLTRVLESDPSLLGDSAYVTHSNPALEHFLDQHPEVARNPDYYLFSELGPGEPGQALERQLWPGRNNDLGNDQAILNDVIPFLVFLVVAGVAIWLLRALLENRRWGRIMKVHTEAHNRLLEKFGSSQELLTYMQTDAGRGFLESAPLETGLDDRLRPGGMAGRLLFSVQAGLVLGLAGVGLLYLRQVLPAARPELILTGTLASTVGAGLLLSAAVSFWLAKHLGVTMGAVDARR